MTAGTGTLRGGSGTGIPGPGRGQEPLEAGREQGSPERPPAAAAFLSSPSRLFLIIITMIIFELLIIISNSGETEAQARCSISPNNGGIKRPIAAVFKSLFTRTL